MKFVQEIWKYRQMLASLVKRDLKSRYQGSFLGFLWMFLNPLMQLAVYTLVFSTIMRSGIEDFYMFLFVALIPWLFFSTCLSAGTTVVFAQQDMVKKIYFPREILPIAFTVSQFVNMLLSFIVIFAAAVLRGAWIEPSAWLCLPCVMLIEFFLALGITFFTAALAVYFRDLEHILAIVSMALMYLTPVIYPMEMVPKQYQSVIYMNPMSSVIIAYREILYYGRVPQWQNLKNAALSGIIVLILGKITFSRLQRGFAEDL